ncbi:MAG: hypothetical protein P8129_20165 [Anaerolineae bacterium]|jgi:hypothetical protein
MDLDSLLVKFFKVQPPRVSEEEAVAIARETCEKLGWRFLEPVHITACLGMWTVRTGWGHYIDANATIKINGRTGQVVSAKYSSR